MGGTADLLLLGTLLSICQKSQKPSFWEVIDSIISVCKFGSFKNPFSTIINLSERCFRFRFILLLQRKKVISMNYGSNTRSWKSWRWERLYLILLVRDIYINFNLNLLTKITSSNRRTEWVWRYPPMDHLSSDHKESPNQQENSHKKCNELGKPIVNDGKSKETETTTWSEFPNGGKAIIEQILASEEINESRRAGLRIIVWYLSRKANHLSKVVWERKTITELTISISSARIGKWVFVVDVKVSKDKHISRWVDQENRIFVR